MFGLQGGEGDENGGVVAVNTPGKKQTGSSKGNERGGGKGEEVSTCRARGTRKWSRRQGCLIKACVLTREQENKRWKEGGRSGKNKTGSRKKE